MNALTTIDRNHVAAVMPSFDFNDLERIATAIARGGLFGSKDPYAVLTLCMLAQAEGQHPAVVFRDYHLISGKPAKKAEAMQRDFLAAGGKIEWHELTDDCCDATFSHPQGGSARISWDKARVKQAQLGSNAMHTKYPRQMLRSRVISEGVRTVFPGATSGMYVPEEVADFADVTPARAAPPMPQPTRARDMPALTERAAAVAPMADAGENMHDAEPAAASATLTRCLENIASVKSINGLSDIRKRDTAAYRTLDAAEQTHIRATLAARTAELAPNESAEYGEQGDEA